MFNYPLGVYDCGKCGKVVGSYHDCEPESVSMFEVYYSKDGGKEWFLTEETNVREKALDVANELIDDGFESQVVDGYDNTIFCSIQNKKDVA